MNNCFVLSLLATCFASQAKLNEQTPALDTCEEALPAVFFGTYDLPSEAALQARQMRSFRSAQ